MSEDNGDNVEMSIKAQLLKIGVKKSLVEGLSSKEASDLLYALTAARASYANEEWRQS